MTNPIKQRLTAKQVAQTLRDTRGMVTVAASRLGVTRQTIYNWYERSDVVKQAMKDARESMTDTAELKLYEAIVNGEQWAINLYLRTQGADRGYKETQNINHSGNLTIEAVAKLSDEEVERLAVERGLPELE